MKIFLVSLLLTICILQNPAVAKKKHAQNIPAVQELILVKMIENCVAQRDTQAARADIFTHFIEASTIRGTPAKITDEICLATHDALPRFVTQQDIDNATKTGVLVPLPQVTIEWPDELPQNRRVLLPFAAAYLTDLAVRARTQGITLRATSLVRTTTQQVSLAHRGASPAHCKKNSLLCSTHTTGASLDISTRNLSNTEIAWLTKELITDMKAHRILFIREYYGGHFHIFVPRPQK